MPILYACNSTVSVDLSQVASNHDPRFASWTPGPITFTPPEATSREFQHGLRRHPVIARECSDIPSFSRKKDRFCSNAQVGLPNASKNDMSGKAIQLRTAKMVLERFPDRSEQILKLYDDIDEVSHICDDLVLATEALERFESRTDRNSATEITDFREVIESLQNELIDIIDSRYYAHHSK